MEIRQAVDPLPDALQEAVTLADIWGFTSPEIARIVGCPVGTVRTRLHRARATLALELEDLARQRRLLRHPATTRKTRNGAN